MDALDNDNFANNQERKRAARSSYFVGRSRNQSRLIVQGIRGQRWNMKLSTHKTVADIKDTICLAQHPPLGRANLAIIYAATTKDMGKNSTLHDSTDTQTIDCSGHRLFVVLRVRGGGKSGGGINKDTPAPASRQGHQHVQEQLSATNGAPVGSTSTAAPSLHQPIHDPPAISGEPAGPTITSPSETRLTDALSPQQPANAISLRVQLCPAAVLAAVDRGENAAARRQIPQWMMLHLQAKAALALHAIPPDAVRHMQQWFIATKGSELRKATSLRKALNAAAHVAKTVSTTLLVAENVRTHHKKGREFVPRSSYSSFTILPGSSQPAQPEQPIIMLNTNSVDDLLFRVQTRTGLNRHAFLLSAAKRKVSPVRPCGAHDSNDDISFQPSDHSAQLQTWIQELWNGEADSAGEFDLHLTLSHEMTRTGRPIMTVVFEHQNENLKTSRTLLFLARDPSLNEIKRLLAISTQRRSGHNVDVDNIVVHMPAALVHSTIVKWHVTISPTCSILQPLLRCSDWTNVIRIQWKGHSSYIGINNFTKITLIMDMVSKLTGLTHRDFRLQAQSGGRPAKTTLSPLDLCVSEFVNLDYDTTVSVLNVLYLDHKDLCDQVTVIKSLSSDEDWLLGHNSRYRDELFNNDLHPGVGYHARLLTTTEEQSFPFTTIQRPMHNNPDNEWFLEITANYGANPPFWPILDLRQFVEHAALNILREHDRPLLQLQGMNWTRYDDIFAMHNSQANVMPRCHINSQYGVHHILQLATDDISTIHRLAVTVPDNFLHVHTVIALMSEAWPRLVNVTHLHIDGAGHDARDGREQAPNLTALATIQNLQHLELFDMPCGVLLPQGDNLSTLTSLHLCASAPSLTTIPSNSHLPFVTPPRHTQLWRGPANLKQLTITRNKSGQDYTWITDLTNLRSLRILQPLIRVKIPCILTHMTTLTMLDTTDDDRAPTNLAAFARLKNLKLARLSHLDDREDVVRNLLTNNANLDHLEIGQCYYMSHHVFCNIDVSSPPR